MINRPRLPHRRSGSGRPRGAPTVPPVAVGPGHTVPLPVVPAPAADERTDLGFPAEVPGDEEAGRPAAGGQGAVPVAEQAAAVPGVRVVAVPRREPVGGLALVLAGAAAEASLWLPWWRGAGVRGLPLVRQGLVVLRSHPGALGSSGLWQPVAVVLGGGVLLLLGPVLFRRARSHRPAGLLALLVALAAAAGVVVPIANADWSVRSLGPGMWCALAVVLLGGTGALKAMLTAPAVTVQVA